MLSTATQEAAQVQTALVEAELSQVHDPTSLAPEPTQLEILRFATGCLPFDTNYRALGGRRKPLNRRLEVEVARLTLDEIIEGAFDMASECEGTRVHIPRGKRYDQALQRRAEGALKAVPTTGRILNRAFIAGKVERSQIDPRGLTRQVAMGQLLMLAMLPPSEGEPINSRHL